MDRSIRYWVKIGKIAISHDSNLPISDNLAFRLKGAHKMIIEVLNEYFGNVPDGVKTRVSSIDNQSTLKALLFESFKSKDLKSFENHL
jgi:hypothetical protein